MNPISYPPPYPPTDLYPLTYLLSTYPQELYGFDYMVDDDYNAWLIEINSSPACDYSTKITSRYHHHHTPAPHTL